ncbi:MAG: pantoate--beta-alanine ligase [Woeseia sp.]
MLLVSTGEALREQLDDWRHGGEHIALVPTMGNLHDGHLSLVSLAREHAERVVVSVFVNPTQFGEGEDFEAYPRTLERDKRHLRKARADLLFVPDVETIYPFGIDRATSVSVPVLTEEFCGAARPGHFDGVTSVVSRLFVHVQPDVAVFGQKDYQQLLVIRRLVDDLKLPMQIVAGPTRREADGLALSSRNDYLSETERQIAPALYAVLQDVGSELQAGRRDYEALEHEATDRLSAAGFEPEYVGVRRAADLEPPDADSDEIVVLAAARLGKARLIDNVIVSV